MSMRKVLVIAYYFPPIGGSGTQRPAKFVKYLPEFGWQPYVISTDRPYGDGDEGRDETLLAGIPPDVSVWRVPTPQPKPVYRLARWFGWQSATMLANRAGALPESATTETPITIKPSSLARLRHALLAPLYAIHNPPVDPALYWALRIVPLARRLISQEQIDVIFTTVPPWSLLIAGALLRRLTGRPWVADFRDPWTENEYVYYPTPVRRRLDQALERRLLDRADSVIAVTAPWLDGLRRKTQETDRPFVVIPNGWDRNDFPDLERVRKGLPPPVSDDGRIVLLHPGSAYQGELLPLLRGLERLAEVGDVGLDRLYFHFIGAVHPEDRQAIESSCHNHRFRFDTQRVSHDKALRMMQEAHILVLLRKGYGAASGKIFEYMAVGRPVLAITSGVAGNLIRDCGVGRADKPDDVAKIAEVLQQIATDYVTFVQSVYHPNWSLIETFERRAITGKLATVLHLLAQWTIDERSAKHV